MSVEQAIRFVCDELFDPTINHPEIGEKPRNIAKNFRVWATEMTHTGNLLDLLNFLNKSQSPVVFEDQVRLGITTITDILPKFKRKFADELEDRLTTDNLQVGADYSTRMIHAICGSYDLRSGGILPVWDGAGSVDFVAIKATLNGGTYENRWIESRRRLKYFMKAISGNFSESYRDNAAIINNPQKPVLAFVRETSSSRFTYYGRFFLLSIQTEEDGSKWFDLASWGDGMSQIAYITDVEHSLNDKVKASQRMDATERRKRLEAAASQPGKQRVVTTAYQRNPDVIAEVLYRANGVCESCGKNAPFERLSDGSPFLEVHHKVPLAQNGPDTVENAAALCPNCHRREHYGKAKWPH